MTDRIAQWEAAAVTAAAELCAKLDGLVVSPINLVTVPRDGADGSNSENAAYLQRLQKRQHLTDKFLSDN